MWGFGNSNNQQASNQPVNNAGNNQPTNSSNGTNNSGENNQNNQNNEPLNRGIWDNKSQGNNGENNNNNNSPNNSPNTNGNNTQALTPEQLMRQHLDSQSFMSNLDTSNWVDQDGNLNEQNVQAAFKQVAENTYSAVLKTMNSVMNSRINDAVKQAVNESTGTVNSQLAVAKMNEKIPFTSAPDMKPIANAMLSRFIQSGQSVEKAIDSVSVALSDIANAVMNNSSDFSSNNNRGNRQNLSGFNGSNENEPDWMELLGGKAG